MSYVEFSRRDVEAILKKTMRSVGYRGQLVEVGVWSAIWLEERLNSGISKLLLYLALIRDRQVDGLRPAKHPEFGIKGICPFMLAEAIIDLSDRWLPRGSVAFGAPAEPFLMMASIADWASHKGKSVRFRHLNYSCLMSNAGIDIEAEKFGVIDFVSPDANEPMMIELTDDLPRYGGFGRHETFQLPEARLRGKGALKLD